MARTLEANPFVIELAFPEARPVSETVLLLGSAYLQVRVSATVSGTPEPVVFETTFQRQRGRARAGARFWRDADG